MNSLTAVVEHWLQDKVNDAVSGHKSRIEYLEGFVSSLSERLDKLEKAFPDLATTKDLQKDTRPDVLIDKLHYHIEREIHNALYFTYVKQGELEESVKSIIDRHTVRMSDDALDAKRYRWLREQHWTDDVVAVVEYPEKNVQPGSMCYSGGMLDEFIDEKMVKEVKK